MSIRVFISHSTWPNADLAPRLQDQALAHSLFRRRLCERLAEDPAITVVVDENIPPGRLWRDSLFKEIAECRAAIVLVNEQALHHSPWLDTEIKVLGYRAHNEKDDFCLIVVPFGGVTGADIAKHSSWQPVAITELQMLPRHGLNEANAAAVDEVISQIVSTLRQMSESVEDKSPLGWLVSRLCALLQMKASDLKEIGESLGADTTGIENASLVRRRVARALYREGPLAIHKLRTYPNCKLEDSDLDQILDILNTYWIDMTASIGILSCGMKTTSHRVIAINGREAGYTPKAYVRQVCGQAKPWPVVTVNPKCDVVGQIRDTLVECFRGLPPEFDRATPEEITQGLNQLLAFEHSVPVFVAFLQEGGGTVNDLTAAISRAFPSIRIIVCTGTEQGRAILPEGIYMLMPELSLADEARAFKEYFGVRTHL